MFETIGEHAQGERLGLLDGLPPCRAVGKNAGKLSDFGDPATVVFPVDFDFEFHRQSSLRSTFLIFGDSFSKSDQ